MKIAVKIEKFEKCAAAFTKTSEACKRTVLEFVRSSGERKLLGQNDILVQKPWVRAKRTPACVGLLRKGTDPPTPSTASLRWAQLSGKTWQPMCLPTKIQNTEAHR
jgi:hypothetical protein